jgi:hypothetical protein
MIQTFKHFLLLLIILSPFITYSQIIGKDTTRFTGQHFERTPLGKHYRKNTIIIYPDSTCQSIDYYTSGPNCKRDIDKSKASVEMGIWTMKDNEIRLHFKSVTLDYNFFKDYRIKPNELIYIWKKQKKVRKSENDIIPKLRIGGVKPIIHYKKVKKANQTVQAAMGNGMTSF